jgi:hypothetical protein
MLSGHTKVADQTDRDPDPMSYLDNRQTLLINENINNLKKKL